MSPSVASSALAVRVAVFTSLTVLVPACAPGSCQGTVEQGSQVKQKDVGAAAPKCPGTLTTFVGDVDIRDQQDMDDMANCEVVEGNVFIHDSDDIVDLSGLSALNTISDGYLLVQDNAALVDASLDALVVVDLGVGFVRNPVLEKVQLLKLTDDGTDEGIAFGDITVRDNDALETLSFPEVKRLQADERGGAGSLIIGNNPSLTSLGGFAQLESIGGLFLLFGNDALEDFQGLENLTEIANVGTGAAVAFGVGIDFNNVLDIVPAGNNGLVDFDGLQALASVNGDIVIGFNAQLQSFNGLSGITTHAKNIFVAGNEELTSLAGLEGDGGADGVEDGLQTLTGSLFIGVLFDHLQAPVAAGNASFARLEGLESLTTLGGNLTLAFNEGLQDFDGLDLLATVGGDVTVVGSPNLNNFNGALALTTINGNLFLGQLLDNDGVPVNPVLDVNGNAVDTGVDIDLDPASVNGFPVLTTVQKDVVVAFSAVDRLRIADTLTDLGGRFIVHGNANLETLEGLEALTSLGGLVVGASVDKDGTLRASPNGTFQEFTGFNLTAIGNKGLVLAFEPELDSLVTLPTLASVGGDVVIAGLTNEDLTSLVDLDIASITGDLVIGALKNANGSLVDANMPQLETLALDDVTSVGGNVFVGFCENLTDVDMPIVTSVDGALQLTDLPALVDVNDLPQLAGTGSVVLRNLTALETIDLPALVDVEDDLTISDNALLESVSLPQLGNVGATLELSRCPLVEDLATLTNLAGVGSLVLADDEALADFIGLNNLSAVIGDLALTRLPALSEIELPALTSIGGSLVLTDLDGVNALDGANGDGLALLTSIGKTLDLADNDGLSTLQGLEALATIGEKISLRNNATLDTVLIDDNEDHIVDVGDEGLVGLQQVGDPTDDDIGGDRGVVEATNNAVLDETQLEDLVDNFAQDFLGFTVLCGNAAPSEACGT